MLSDDIRIGPPKLTRFERTRIVGARALQLSLGAPILVQLEEEVTEPIDIAIQELNAGALPMTLRRTLPDGTFQDIPLADLLRHDSDKQRGRNIKKIGSMLSLICIKEGDVQVGIGKKGKEGF